MAKLNTLNVDLNLGIFRVQGSWVPNRDDQEAAWETYIELVTRISIIELRPDEGLLREALSSLHTLFTTIREILSKHGPIIARSNTEGDLTFGFLAIVILNYVLRPLLSKWHPLLLDYEESRSNTKSRVEHERNWDKNEELRQELNRIRFILLAYTDLLAQVAEIPSLIIDHDTPPKESKPRTLNGRLIFTGLGKNPSK